MPLYRESVDLTFTTEGDFLLGSNGDLEDTTKRLYRSKIQQITTRIMSSRGDWPLQPDVGANLGQFLGRPNNQETGEDVRIQILSELAREGLVSPSHLSVDVVPISQSEIAIILVVTPPGSKQAIYISLSYSMSQNKLTARNV